MTRTTRNASKVRTIKADPDTIAAEGIDAAIQQAKVHPLTVKAVQTVTAELDEATATDTAATAALNGLQEAMADEVASDLPPELAAALAAAAEQAAAGRKVKRQAAADKRIPMTAGEAALFSAIRWSRPCVDSAAEFHPDPKVTRSNASKTEQAYGALVAILGSGGEITLLNAAKLWRASGGKVSSMEQVLIRVCNRGGFSIRQTAGILQRID